MQHYLYMLFLLLFFPVTMMAQQFVSSTTKQSMDIQWDAKSLIIDGHRVVPAMGEMHYSRIPEAEWRGELEKMKEGGINILATYILWNHIEEVEGQFDWSGQRNLRKFLKLCKEVGMAVVIRIGPWCHAEVRLGGIPDWVFTKECETRTEDPVFMELSTYWYRQGLYSSTGSAVERRRTNYLLPV